MVELINVADQVFVTCYYWTRSHNLDQIKTRRNIFLFFFNDYIFVFAVENFFSYPPWQGKLLHIQIPIQTCAHRSG